MARWSIQLGAGAGAAASNILYLVPGVAIQALLQALLVEGVPNQTNGPRQDE